jgi:hypothetical protein
VSTVPVTVTESEESSAAPCARASAWDVLSPLSQKSVVRTFGFCQSGAAASAVRVLPWLLTSVAEPVRGSWFCPVTRVGPSPLARKAIWTTFVSAPRLTDRAGCGVPVRTGGPQ